jgi:SAM-dependent methyltransferase
MSIELPPAHRHLRFMNALSQQRADGLVAFLIEGLDDGTVLDAGCGWAELLLQVVAASPHSRGVGIDLDAGALAHGRALADERGLAERVSLVEGDVKAHAPDRVDAVICSGASHVWAEPVDGAPMDYTGALTAIRERLPRGGRAVYAEGIWSAPPTPAAVAPLGGSPDELVFLPDLVDLAVAAGFEVAGVAEASPDEWDDFESGYTAGYVSWLAEHPADHPDAAEVRERARRQREGYLRGYRGVLGMAYLRLTAV